MKDTYKEIDFMSESEPDTDWNEEEEENENIEFHQWLEFYGNIQRCRLCEIEDICTFCGACIHYSLIDCEFC